MRLKTQYTIGTIGFMLMAFGGGMLVFGGIIGYPKISILSAMSAIIFGLGLAISIKMLSTMKKIEVSVDELP